MYAPGRLLAALLAAIAIATLIAASAKASVWDRDGPWGPYGWDAEAGRFHQPQLGEPIPPPAAKGAFYNADFDGDGVRNIADNCLLVANPKQEPAAKPARTGPIGPADMLRLSRAWNARHPNAPFLDDSELGEACSGYNDNYLRTTKVLIDSSNRRKLEVFRFLGVSGPMYGGAARPFPNGKPTEADEFFTLSGDTEPNPTTGEGLAQNADGTLAHGNLTPSMPMCSGYDQYVAFFRWITGGDQTDAFAELEAQLRTMYEEAEQSFGCGSDLQRPAWTQAMRHFWAGKRLYTNARGGRITNRFFGSVTEQSLFESLLGYEPFNTFAEQSGAFPFADDGSGQSRHGIIFRGRSYIDGRGAIMMDWRGFEAAWPLGPGTWIDGVAGMLIYDECRAIQTGVYNCTAVTDWAFEERRHTFQEGYMPWVTKGPPTIDEYIATTR